MKRIFPISSAQFCPIRVIRYHSHNSPNGALIKKSFRRIAFVKDLSVAEVNMPMDYQV